MREIKFRAYHKTRKQMITPVWTFGEHYQFDNEFHNKWMYGIEAKDITLLQFTGMTDCDGKDIYEGDIIQSMFMLEEENCVRLYLIEWMDEFGSRFAARSLLHPEFTREKSSYVHFPFLKLDGKSPVNGVPIHKSGNYKVVGNMYENPEMINENC